MLKSSFLKNNNIFFENYPEHDRARRESSRRETRGKMIAVAFSRWHFLRVRGQKNRKTYLRTSDPPAQAADALFGNPKALSPTE